MCKFLPKQGDVNKILKQINRKILRHTKLPLTLKHLKAACLTSPHFRDIYQHILQNRVPINKTAARRLEMNVQRYMILDGQLFKIIEGNNGELDSVLCIPTFKVHVLLNMYHSTAIMWTFGHNVIKPLVRDFIVQI